MLRAATTMINKAGLTVSLDHISFEDVIRDAGVSRSAVYRRWPYKDLFFSDLLRELAGATSPATIPGGDAAVELIKRVALEHLDWLDVRELRHDLVVELLRQGALRDFEIVHGSTEWRTYLALHATFLSLADGDLRDDVRITLAQSERGFITRIARSYEQMADLFGYRLRPELNATFDTLASVATATMRGLVITALSTSDVVTRRIQAAPFGTARTAEWSQPALGIASIVFTFLEADPTIAWDDERAAKVRQALESEGAAAFIRR
jgi:AcrR family transcriptional regulator